jgi:cbb3-type cytochrome oxidase maturation protein
MFQAAIAILMIMGLIAASALAAFWWAAKNKQFENVEEGSLTIFDADEPIGKSTDAFPGQSNETR